MSDAATIAYRLEVFSRSRSGERDLARCDERPTVRSFDFSRSREDFRRLCFLFEGLRDRPMVSYHSTKSKRRRNKLDLRLNARLKDKKTR